MYVDIYSYQKYLVVTKMENNMSTSRKLGKLVRKRNNIPHYSQMRESIPISIPSNMDWSQGMPNYFGSMLNAPDPNDPIAPVVGDCTIAALHHARQIWTFNTQHKMITDGNKDVLADYESICGYKLGDPLTDNGACLQDVLFAIMKSGITTDNGPDIPIGYVEADPRIQSDVAEIIAFGGVLYFGIGEMPERWVSSNPGAIWDIDSGSKGGGHCIIAMGYDNLGLDIISWGFKFRITWRAFQQYCDECYWVLSKDWLTKGISPGNINMQQLEEYMQQIKND